MIANLTEEESLRSRIKLLVKDYYNLVHAPQQSQEFIPGKSRVSYAGRVFNELEMMSLTDATLDFWLTSGRFCDEFETKFAQKVGVKYALLVNSGSSANLIAFSALTSHLLGERRIKKGDEVITVAAGFPTTVTPIIQFGAVPVFVDVKVSDGTYQLDVSYLEKALSPKSKAVMVAHTLGNTFDIDAVSEFCKSNNLWLVEDNCDALGSTYRGRSTGSWGDIATSSFYPPHHLTMGEGGAVYTNNSTLKRAAESFRDWGRDCWCPSGKDNTCKKRFNWQLGSLPHGYDHKYIYSHFGYNLKATEMQAAIGVVQLDKLDLYSQMRRNNFAFLRESLEPLSQFFILPNPTKHSEPSWFGFPLTLKEACTFTRTELTRFLESKNIQTRMLFAGNLLRHPMFNEIRGIEGSYRVIGNLVNSDLIAERTFWLGVYPGMTSPMLKYMVEQIYLFIKGERA